VVFFWIEQEASRALDRCVRAIVVLDEGGGALGVRLGDE